MPPRKRARTERVLTDPRAIRALAHPARLTVLEELGHGAELTATACAELVGLSPSAMSYHLRALEKYGFVERVEPAGDGRERPWRATAPGWRIEEASETAQVTATEALATAMFGRIVNDLGRWSRAEPGEPKAWREAAVVNNSVLWLTAAEASRLGATFRELMATARGRTAADHPPGARRVRTSSVVLPVVATE